jgi:hypothetical protein
MARYWKGFNPDMTCNGKQYAENTDFEEPGGKICGPGVIHYCKNPFDVWDYYGPVNNKGELNVFSEVEPLAEEQQDDNKYATTKLHIGTKIDLKGFVKAGIDFLLKKTKCEVDTTVDSKNSAKIGSSGDSAKIGSSGYSAQIGSSGDYAKIGSSGDYAKIGSSGYSAQIGSSGYYAKIGSSGDSAKIGSSGNSAQIGSSGDYAKIGSSGYSAKIDVSGTDSVVCCAGSDSIVKAKAGNWITLSEWEYSKGKYIPKCVKTEYVDGKKIKADTWYKLVNGKFTEVEE